MFVRGLVSGFVLQIVVDAPKIPENVIIIKKLTQQSGLYRPKMDPKWRHILVLLYRGSPLGAQNDFKKFGRSAEH